MGVVWQHRIKWWTEPLERWDTPEDDKEATVRRLEAKLDALSDGGWEIVKYEVTNANETAYIWTLWKRKVEP